jgi:hypothetical protein
MIKSGLKVSQVLRIVRCVAGRHTGEKTWVYLEEDLMNIELDELILEMEAHHGKA